MAKPLKFHECDHVERLEHTEFSFWKLLDHQYSVALTDLILKNGLSERPFHSINDISRDADHRAFIFIIHVPFDFT